MITFELQKKACAVFVFMLFVFMQPVIVFAQDDPEFDTSPDIQVNRVLGDQFLHIDLGTQIPLFIQNPNPQSGETAISETNLRVGMSGSLGWAAFLNNEFSIGIDLNAAYSSDLNGIGFFAVPVLVNSSYFFRLPMLEIPVQLGIGLDIMRYRDMTAFAPIVKAGTAVYWNAIQDWSFGLNLSYWWVPEFYSGNGSIPSSNTRFGNFLEVTASALYNFQ